MYAKVYSVSVCDSLASPMKKPKSAKYLVSLVLMLSSLPKRSLQMHSLASGLLPERGQCTIPGSSRGSIYAHSLLVD